jgi:hypothetical protein
MVGSKGSCGELVRYLVSLDSEQIRNRIDNVERQAHDVS